MAYLLDADVFIRAKNVHYGFDFCPAFWEWLVADGADGRAVSSTSRSKRLVYCQIGRIRV